MFVAQTLGEQKLLWIDECVCYSHMRMYTHKCHLWRFVAIGANRLIFVCSSINHTHSSHVCVLFAKNRWITRNIRVSSLHMCRMCVINRFASNTHTCEEGVWYTYTNIQAHMHALSRSVCFSLLLSLALSLSHTHLHTHTSGSDRLTRLRDTHTHAHAHTCRVCITGVATVSRID